MAGTWLFTGHFIELSLVLCVDVEFMYFFLCKTYKTSFIQVSTGERASDRDIQAIGKIPLFGYINDLAIGPKARFCVAAVGQEPRLGRWERIARSKNRFAIIQLRNTEDDEKSSQGEESDYDESEDADESSLKASDDSEDGGEGDVSSSED